MKRTLLLLLLVSPLSAQETAPPPSYDRGMALRKAGDHAAARENFLQLLERDPQSNGALEGLALSCISLKRYAEAREALEKWNARSPGNPYVLGLLLRARRAEGDAGAAHDAVLALAAAEPASCAWRERADSGQRDLRGGLFTQGRAYQSHSLEGLDTASPQRILYEGSAAGADFRAPLRPGLDLTGGLQLRTEAQRNEGGGFTYYDLREQAYTAGLEGRGRGQRWAAEYGQSLVEDLESASGRTAYGRLRLHGEKTLGKADLRLTLASRPRFVRGQAAAGYFLALRENSARAEAEGGLLGWDWLVRAGLYATSDGLAQGAFWLRGLRETRLGVFQAAYSHGSQEFYSASADGRLRFVQTDRFSAGLRRGAEGSYQASVSAAGTLYTDGNRLGEAGASLTAWPRRGGELSFGWRYELADYRGAYEGYNSVDESAHWLGAYWRRCRGAWAASAAYEKGFVSDSLLAYQANRYTAALDWYRGTASSLRLQLLKRDSSGRGKGWSAGLQARYSFE